jgi:hypothetical protein
VHGTHARHVISGCLGSGCLRRRRRCARSHVARPREVGEEERQQQGDESASAVSHGEQSRPCHSAGKAPTSLILVGTSLTQPVWIRGRAALVVPSEPPWGAHRCAVHAHRTG